VRGTWLGSGAVASPGGVFCPMLLGAAGERGSGPLSDGVGGSLAVGETPVGEFDGVMGGDSSSAAQ
jgi:hypothetical protein